MAEAGMPGPPNEQAVAIREFSAEARGAAAYNMAAAVMYHQLQTGTPDAIRQAAQWLVTDASIKPRSLRLDDDAFVTDRKLTHLATAQEKVTEAGRIESWAGSLAATAGSEDLATLKLLKWVEGLFLPGIETRPGDMLKFEDETVAAGDRIQTLRTRIGAISEKIDQGTGLETVDVNQAVKRYKPRVGEVVTAVELVALQRDTLTQELEEEETAFRNRTELMEALRTGRLSEGLQERISEAGVTPLDAKPLGDLEFGARTHNLLATNGIDSVGELLRKTEEELREISHLGDKSLDEIIETLHMRGWSLRQAEKEAD